MNQNDIVKRLKEGPYEGDDWENYTRHRQWRDKLLGAKPGLEKAKHEARSKGMKLTEYLVYKILDKNID